MPSLHLRQIAAGDWLDFCLVVSLPVAEKVKRTPCQLKHSCTPLPAHLQAIQRDFGMGLGDIRRVLGLWQVIL